MSRSLFRAAMIASALGALLARPGFAQSQGEITGVTSNGTDLPPGPIIVHNLRIATLQNRNDEVMFNSYFLAPATLDFTVNVSGPGNYFVGYGSLENDTNFSGPGVIFPSISADLVNAPAGSTLVGASYSLANFSNNVTQTSPTSLTFNAPPGIPVGDATSLYVIVDVTAPGPQTFDVTLTAVPEPSTVILGLIAAAAGLGCRARWLCRPA
jgi:hypothetical protein